MASKKKKWPVSDVGSAAQHCPSNHALPRIGVNGECTPVNCGGRSLKGEEATPVIETAIEATHEALTSNSQYRAPRLDGELKLTGESAAEDLAANLTPMLQTLDEETATLAAEQASLSKNKQILQLAQSQGRHSARKAFFKAPTNLPAAEAETWAQAKAVSLLPDALAEIEFQLKMGDDGMRRDAARDVLDINGMRRREAAGAGGATIILNLGGKELPWAQRVVEKLANKGEVATPTDEPSDA